MTKHPTRVVEPTMLLTLLLTPTTPIHVSHNGVTTTAADWRIGPRRVPEHMLFYLVSGAMTGTVAGEPIEIGPGSFYWQQPGAAHELVLAPGVESSQVYYFRIRIGPPPYARLAAPTLVVQDRELLPALAAETVPVSPEQGALQALRTRCLFGDMFCRALDLAAAADRRSSGLSPQQERRTLGYIRAHLEDRYPVATLAAHLGLNPDYFARRCKASFGLPPQALIKRERMQLAMGLLRETTLTVSEVAHRLGYDDLAHFSNQFLDLTGQRPSHYRQA